MKLKSLLEAFTNGSEDKIQGGQEGFRQGH
jgi:hypothetical protein